MKRDITKYWIVVLLLMLKHTCFAQGNTTTPCVGSTLIYSGFTHGCSSYQIEMITGTPNVDYQILSGDFTASKTIKWLRVGSYTMRITYIGCSSPTPSSDIVISVKPSVQPLPLSSQHIEVFDGDDLILVVPAYPGPVNWYDQSNTFLGTVAELHLGKNAKPGDYIYTAKVLNEFNCAVDGTTSATFQVRVKEYTDTYFNRIETKLFDGTGKVVSHTKTYYDDSGALRQTQTKSISRNEVLTSEILKDEYGRPIVSTLVAPIGASEFKHKNRFTIVASGGFLDYNTYGGAYGYLDITTPGTLGWYYSNNNSKESHTAASNYPFIQYKYFDDGSEELATTFGVGEAQSAASGHGVASGVFGVYGELDDYIFKRATLFPGLTQVFNKTGCTLRIDKDQNGRYTIHVFDSSGREIMAAASGTQEDHILAVHNDITSTVENGNRSICYLPLLQTTEIAVTTPYRFAIDDLLIAERDFHQRSQGTLSWGPGLYQIKMFNSDPVNLKYTLYLKDIAYKFYDDRGYLISEVAPNGVKQWLSGTPYSQIDKTTYVYNFKGQLTSTKSIDVGEAKFKYRKDGAIRFSQNAKQKTDLHFSYTNYDELSRPIESGEYIGTEYSYNLLDDHLELSSQIQYSPTEKRDWIASHYDYPDTEFNTLTRLASASYVQSFLRGNVSWTENVNIRTWYSYDEFGRVVWMAQKAKALPRTVVVKYEYDFLGNVLTVSNLVYDVNAKLLHQFYHQYEYDADSRLIKAYTRQEQNGSRRLRASYEYYLHGPLKRIELGDNLQGIDFVYNIQGWLTHINHPDPTQDPGGDANDVFGMVLDYYESDLNNLFTVSATTIHDPLQLHGISNMSTSIVASHQPLIRFNPEASDDTKPLLKKYSADNPIYRSMIKSTSNTH